MLVVLGVAITGGSAPAGAGGKVALGAVDLTGPVGDVEGVDVPVEGAGAGLPVSVPLIPETREPTLFEI